MKRRVISLLSMIALLCTMVVFSMPATAVENDTNSAIEAYKELLKDAKSGAEALEQAIESGDEAQMRLMAKAIKTSIEWKEFHWETEPFPRYIHREVYELAGYDRNEWSISSKEDWEAMREVADAATEDYFGGVTFHLTDDINFGLGTAIKPMGLNENSLHPGVGFAGTIDGHGFGFNNIYIYNSTNSGDKTSSSGKDIIHTGLFQRLGNCTFKDFGLNSGLIYQGSSNTYGAISSFGTVVEGKVPTFERVWSSIYISAQCNARANGLVSTLANSPITVNVNGFVFDGVLAKKDSTANQFSYAVLHSGKNNSNPGTFHNIIADGESYNAKVAVSGNSYAISGKSKSNNVQSALFDFSAVSVLEKLSMGNVYSVKRETDGILGGYSIGTVMSSESKSASLLTDMSAAEVAYTINEKNQKGEIPEGAKPVYFTLNSDGKVRPIPDGKSEGKIIKMTVTGDVTKNLFVNSNSTFDLKTALGYKSELKFEKVAGEGTINGTYVTTYAGDIAVVMTNSCVNHKFVYKSNIEDKQHTGTCSDCGHQILEDCELINCTPISIAWNAATHNGTCEKCEAKFAEVCAFEYKETDDGYKYICKCVRTADASAPVVAGDVNNDETVDLIDAMYVLEKTVDPSVDVDVNNADVDGNNAVGINDVYKIILYFMKDAEVVAEFEATQDRANEPNFYNKETIEVGNLKMDGTEGFNERYVRTDLISVSEGNKVVFGPIRKAQAVMGHFYDKDGKPIELINANNKNLKYEHVFKAEVQGKDVEVIDYGKDAVVFDLETNEVDGLDMVSIMAPEGAAYVRLQANAKEADKFYIRINNEFSLADYQCRTNGDVNTLKNEENGQLFLTVGDSLCSASRDDEDKTVPQRGWEGRIRRNFGAATVDSSEGGAAVSTASLTGEINEDLLTGETATTRQWIVSQLREHHNTLEFEYVLLEGGGNDAHYDAPMGEISDSFDPKTFDDESTYAGAMELLIYETIREHGDTAAIGFMSIYAMPLHEEFKDSGDYFVIAKKICEKWGIPYLDIFNLLKNFDTEKFTTNDDHTKPDYIHAGGTGYDMMQKYIDPFVTGIVPKDMKDQIPETMRPIDQDIYNKVMATAKK